MMVTHSIKDPRVLKSVFDVFVIRGFDYLDRLGRLVMNMFL